MYVNGSYRLNKDIQNPGKDLRANQDRNTSWRSWAEWKEGTVFAIRLEPKEVEGIFVGHTVDIYFSGSFNCPITGVLRPDGTPFDINPGFSALLTALEPIQERASDFLLREELGFHGAGAAALEILNFLGVTPSACAVILREIEAMRPADEDED